MPEKQRNITKTRAPMIRYCSSKQPTLAEFDWPFQTTLDEHNRRVKISQFIPWDELAEGYYQNLSTKTDRPAKDTRLGGRLPENRSRSEGKLFEFDFFRRIAGSLTL